MTDISNPTPITPIFTHNIKDQNIISYRPFPTHLLPAPVKQFITESAQAIGCDHAYVALPLLIGSASLIGNKRQIQLKHAWKEPSILWGAIVGESGSAKSPAMDIALRAIKRCQSESLEAYEAQMIQHQRDLLEYERKHAEWKHSKSNTNPPEEPEAPNCDRYVTDDATIEAIAMLLQKNPVGLLLSRDELTSWLDFDRYSNGSKHGESAKWLELFGGRPLIVDRKTTATIHVPRAAVSIIGGIQSGILCRAIGQDNRDNGLLARLLLVMPPRQLKTWTEDDLHPDTESQMSNIYKRLIDLPWAYDTDTKPQPAILKLTPEAKAIWIKFYNEHNEVANELTGDHAAAWAKLEGYAARLALVIHMLRQASDETVDNEIDAVSISAGIGLSRWFGFEARRVYQALEDSKEDRELRQLVEKIKRKGGMVTIRDWQRLRTHRTADDAEAELNKMVKAGFGRWESSTQSPNGGRPSKRFVLVEESKEPLREPPSDIDAGVNTSTSIPIVDEEDWGEL